MRICARALDKPNRFTGKTYNRSPQDGLSTQLGMKHDLGVDWSTMSTNSVTSLINLEGGQLTEAAQRRPYVGIDFGTSTTVASYIILDGQGKPRSPEPIPIRQLRANGVGIETHLIPSAIAYTNGEIIVGAGARELAPNMRPGVNFWDSFKMDLGEDLGDQYIQSQLAGEDGLPRILQPIHATEYFLSFLRTGIEDFFDSRNIDSSNIAYAVSVPASFEANQRRELLTALRGAGISIDGQVLIDEPNAAFISFAESAEREGYKKVVPTDGFRVLVFDYGAGTCDVSLLEVSPNPPFGSASRNLALSRFTNLGGNDVDYAIAEQHLLPQLLKTQGLSVDDVRRSEVRKRILPSLKASAERLKITICKDVNEHMHGTDLPAAARDISDRVDAKGISIQTMDHLLELSDVKLSPQAFAKTIKPLLDQKVAEAAVSLYGHRLTSIFDPITSALTKASMKIDDVDLVLMVGGSAGNPYVYSAMQQYFQSVDVIRPADTRTTVSQGAALHSYLLHARGINLVTPITSEALLVATKHNTQAVLVPAGTPTSSVRATIDDLVVPTEGQLSVQIPICVGTTEKVVALLNIKSKSTFGFSKGEKVHVTCTMTSDKVLNVMANVGDQVGLISIDSPYANSALTPRLKAVREALKAANNSARSNGGKPSLDKFDRLSQAMSDAGQHHEAAETLETVERIYPGQKRISRRAYEYSRAGKKDLARKLYEEEFKSDPSATTAHNLGCTATSRDEKIKWHEKALEIDAQYPGSLISLGGLLLQSHPERAREMLERGVSELDRRVRSSYADDEWTWNRLADGYDSLGRTSEAAKAREKSKALGSDKDFNETLLASRASDGDIVAI